MEKYEKNNMSLVSLFLAIRTFFKLVFMAFLVVMSLICSAVLYFSPSISNRVSRFWSSLLMWVFNINVRIVGNQIKDKSCLIVSNHLSWTDFIILNYVNPVSFVAKEELSSMPLLGILARLNRCIFTTRTKRASVLDSSVITQYLAKGMNVAMFPESTTTSGNIIPFHSSMFSAAANAAKEMNDDVFVQPVSLVYTKVNGLPLNTRGMLSFAWCAGRSIASMLLDLLSNPGSVEVYVVYHKPIVFTAETDRKKVTAMCEDIIKINISNYRKYGAVALG